MCENCQGLALRWYWNACTWQELEDQISFGQSITWPDQSQSGTEHAIFDQDVSAETFITQSMTDSTLTLEIKQETASWDIPGRRFCSTSNRIKNQHQVAFWAYLDHIRLCRFHGLVIKQTAASHSSAEAIIAQVLFVLWHDRRPTEFQHNDNMKKTHVQNGLRLEMALDSMWIVCVHESQTAKNNWKQACMCIELCSNNYITLSTQIWIEWPVWYKLTLETLWFHQSKRSRILLHTIKGFAHLCDLFLNLWNENIIDLLQVSRYILHTTCTSSRSIICSCLSSAVDPLRELFPRIRIPRIRTALNGRLNEGFPVCSPEGD